MKKYYCPLLSILLYLSRIVITQCDPVPTHTIVRDQIFYASYYTRIWIPNLNKDKGVDIHRQFSETKNAGNGLSYLAVTATRITHYVFVSFNKEGKEWCYLILLVPKTSLECNKLFRQQRKRG